MANNTYKYLRYMRDGSVEERTGVIRSKTANKKDKKNDKNTSKENCKENSRASS